MAVTNFSNGEPYFLKADIAKEGQSNVCISNYIKMRVGDNGKILPVQWYDQNRVMNVNGMIPFIQGMVGQYTTDDNNKIIMAPDADYRDWQGSAANTRDGGWADYILSNQMFTQEGIFFGKIGLLDGNGRRLTSVNIWFRVFGDDVAFGLTQKYYSDKLEKMVQEFQTRTEQAVKDFNAKIEAGTENNRTALNALGASIQANRDEQANIAEQQAAITRQINDQDIITKKEYESNIATVKASINERLSQMKTAPVGVDNYQTLINTYPNGADGIFLALDSKHIWMWLNGQWKDCGVYQSAGLDQEVQQSIGDTRSVVLKENLIENGSFAAGTTQPAYSNTGTGELSLFQFLNRTWLNFVSESETAFQGVSYNFKNPILTSGINYPMHFEMDLISKELITLQINLIGFDANGDRIGGASGGQTLGTVTLYPWRMKHEVINSDINASFADAQTLCLQIAQAEAKPIGTLRMTGLCANLILPTDPIQTENLIDNSLLESGLNNGAYSNTNSGNLSVMRQFAGRNWLRLITNYVGSYNGISWDIDNPLKVLGQNYPLHIAFDLMTQDVTKLVVNVIPKNLDGTVYNNDTGMTIDNIESLPWKLFREDMTALLKDSYVAADRLTFQVIQNDPKPISDLRMTDIKLELSPLRDKYTGNLIINDDYTPSDVFSAYKSVSTGSILKAIFANKEWVHYTSSTQAPWQGLSWKVKNPITDLGVNYPLSLSFVLGSDAERTLSVNLVGYDESGNRIGGDSGGQTLKTIHTHPWQFEDYHIEFNIDDLYTKSKYFVLQIVQADNKELSYLRITDLELKINYSLQDNSPYSDISKLEQKYNLPIMLISGDTSGMNHDTAKNITYKFKNGHTYLEGHGTLKWQGSSSTTFPKKAYRLKTTKSDFQSKNKIKVIPSWDYHHKFNIKAYYNDGLLSRDPVAAQVGGAIWAQRNDLPNDLVKEDNFGFIDGFPILLYINNQFQGVYSFNLPRPEFDYTKWAIMGAEYNDITEFKNIGAEGVKLDGSDFESLNPEDKPTAEEKTAVTELIRWVINSSDEEFKNNLDKHFNINSLVDYVVFTNIVGARDAYGKNQILMTWDGKIWYYQSYDLDCIYNANWMGGKTFESPQVGDELYFGSNNNLFVKFSRLFKDKIAQRYQEVRQWCTPDYILRLFKARVDQIGQDNFKREWSMWNDPSKDTEDFKQLRLAVYDHFKVADAVWLKK